MRPGRSRSRFRQAEADARGIHNDGNDEDPTGGPNQKKSGPAVNKMVDNAEEQNQNAYQGGLPQISHFEGYRRHPVIGLMPHFKGQVEPADTSK
jgi:hypothetical protein